MVQTDVRPVRFLRALLVVGSLGVWAVGEARRCDVWVDLGLLTFARATVTLGEGAADLEAVGARRTAGRGAPPEVVEDLVRRRHAHQDPVPSRGDLLARCAKLTRAYLSPAIDAPVTAYG
ncbi:hypothetical protein LK07_07600 [Streptomyces pluripotens]|uniref:Uncharacterized protein n=1 Tax=Streptomyces pluripotens TaxID=1355015 RepID=A0A221NV81_9ACTN|nr:MULTISPECIES: hypothetical protein [Streptomyces]ARP69657.1 hypothetical protein LK06_006495 [Streptomyces pluripotens]ASN23913.1 hypothetical protein LK07_07600 [Streptomyces pluripotens]MCH0558583.1 hypothetical protein [Streptomyces sp. MUM 16J]